jgi:DNA-binding NtrC family response regulator
MDYTKTRPQPHVFRTGTLFLPGSAHNTLGQSAWPPWIVGAGAQGANTVDITDATSPILIGRDPSCSIVLADPEVSAIHAEIRAEPHGVLLRDLGSKNGTIVGGVRVREGNLMAACTVQIGSTLLRFEPRPREQVEIAEEERLGALRGRAPSMRHLFRRIRRIAPTNLSVLITGETGTGKELVARALHDHSLRSQGPFVVVDCASIPPTLAESELFGHKKGAFTGADKETDGAFHEADGGTLFLDEIGELPVDIQPKLLRALEEKTIKRVGVSKYDIVDVRIVAATLRNLGDRTNTGNFRSDLFFRIAHVQLYLPPLRERRADIPVLVQGICERIGKPERAAEMIQLVSARFAQHEWPGNVRELVNFVALAAELPPDDAEAASFWPPAAEADPVPSVSAFGKTKREATAAFEKEYFVRLAAESAGIVSEMARRSGLERHHVRRYLRKYGISV